MAFALDTRKYSLMECPVCLDWLLPPVSCCENGHGTCSKCRAEIDKCPVCRGKFVNFKITLLDQVVETYLIRCPNHPVGCKECFLISEIKKHEEECFFRKVNCCLCVVRDMDLLNINDHFNKNHTKNANRVAGKYSDPLSLILDIKREFLLGKSERYVTCKEKYFIVHVTEVENNFLARFFYKKEDHVLYLCVQYLGKKQEKAGRYMYTIRIDQRFPKPNQQSFFTLSAFCSPYNQFVNWGKIEENEETVGLRLKSVFSNFNYLSKDFAVEIKVKKFSS